MRVVDVFVDELDLATLGFDGMTPAITGRPSYHPSVLLKLYIYGYLNRIQSSRRLERECQRNVELMWLTGRLTPDFKTIADFRKDNAKGIRNACKRFVGLCRELKLFTQSIVAIDGSKFKAVNSRERNYTQGKIERRERELEENIQRYLDALETADLTQPVELQTKTERLQDKIAKLRQKMKDLQEIKTQLQAQPDGQLSLTDPDARAMTTHSMKGNAAEADELAATSWWRPLCSCSLSQRCSTLAFMSWSLAIAAMEAPGCWHAATSSALNWRV